jgi:L-fucose mutarotase
MTHPALLRALAASGHGGQILIADGNYPHTTGVNPRCELVSLNLAPGLLTADQVLAVLKETVPIERAAIMVPEGDPGAEIAAHVGYRAALADVPFDEHGRFAFYDAARGADVGIVIATGDQRLYANLLLTIGVRAAGS